MKKTTTKKMVWVCLISGIMWVWCSYVLAWFGRADIAESLSRTAVVEVVGVVLVYCLKSLLEKRESFGAVGKSEEKRNDTTKRDL